MFRRIIHFLVVLSLSLTLFAKTPPRLAFAAKSIGTEAAVTQVRYVAPTGSDSGNDCTISGSPCETIIHAVNEAFGGDTISIAAGTYPEAGSIFVANNLQFLGAGVDQTILDGGGTHRVVYNGSATVSFTDLTIQNGNISDGSGAGGILNGGDLTLTRVKVTNNTVASFGGGIITYGNLTVLDSTISNNHATGIGEFNYGYGAGIFISGASPIVTIDNTTISGNSAAESGGGIHNQGQLSLDLTNVTLSDNTADHGAGLSSTNFNTTTILNSTFSNNHLLPGGFGGGILNHATLNIKNTIVAGNEGNQCSNGGTWTSQGYNISSDATCAFTQPSDQDNTDPLLAPLANYGGNTHTHALLSGSPAIDTGTNTGCPLIDQRGVSRPQGSFCDIGAYEWADKDSIGFWNPNKSKWYLKYENSAGDADNVFKFGPVGVGWTPITGDWDGNGVDTVGYWNPVKSKWYLKNDNSGGEADLVFYFGPVGVGWTPIIGDWDGNGSDTIGYWNPNKSKWYLKNDNSEGDADVVFVYGPVGVGWEQIIGDWDGDGDDTIGYYNPNKSKWYLKNDNSIGNTDVSFYFGPVGVGWEPIVGDWDGDGDDTIGFYNPNKSKWYLKNDNSGGEADVVFVFGPVGVGWEPITGNWQ